MVKYIRNVAATVVSFQPATENDILVNRFFVRTCVSGSRPTNRRADRGDLRAGPVLHDARGRRR